MIVEFAGLCTASAVQVCWRRNTQSSAQYTKFCKVALLGHVGHKYVKQGMRCCCYRCSTARNIPCLVYERRGYVSLVAKAAETSMQSAVEDVVARPEYAKDGEVRNCKSINFPHSNCRIFCSLVGHHRRTT